MMKLTPGVRRKRAHEERARVRSHLRIVEEELRARDDAFLPPDLRMERRRNLDTLREYWKRGVFPRNTDHPGKRLAHIRDRYGTSCAVARMIEISGGEALVDTLDREDPLVWIGNVGKGPLLDWIGNSGLTQGEAALIQPGYWDFDEDDPETRGDTEEDPTEVRLFTERGREVLRLALEESRRLGADLVGTEHILVGLLREGEGVAAKALRRLDVDVRTLRREVERLTR